MTGMDTTRATWLADQIAAATTALGTGLTGLREAPAADSDDPSYSPFGNTTAGYGCRDAYRSAAAHGDAAALNLGLVLTSDSSRLREVIQVFRTTDADSADRICMERANSLTVYSAHLTSGGGATDDAQRAVQSDNLSAVLPDGTVLVGADANMDYQPDGLTGTDDVGPARFQDMIDDHGLVDVGDVDADAERQALDDARADGSGQPGDDATGGRDIDHVLASGSVAAGAPVHIDKDEVGGNLLDHDGTVVPIQPARW